MLAVLVAKLSDSHSDLSLGAEVITQRWLRTEPPWEPRCPKASETLLMTEVFIALEPEAARRLLRRSPVQGEDGLVR